MRPFIAAAGSAAWGVFCGMQDIFISQGLGRAFIIMIPPVLIGSITHLWSERVQ